MSLWEMYKAKRLGYADDLWTSLIGHRLGGYSWISTDYEQTPYIYRAMPNLSHYYNREIMEEVVGGTVAWNQLVQMTTDWGAESGITIVEDTDDHITFASPARATSVFPRNTPVPLAKQNSVYLVMGKLKAETAGRARFLIGSVNINSGGDVDLTTDYKLVGSVIKFTGTSMSNRDVYVAPKALINVNISVKKDICCFDLTAMFGSTIADYIYSLEQATAGAGVAFFKTLFPKPYYAYNAGELKSVSGLVSHDMTGFNQWDEEWELGDYDSTTGLPHTANARIRSKNLIPVVPNTRYYFSAQPTLSYSSWLMFYFYDANKNYLSFLSPSANAAFTTPANAHYIHFCTSDAWGDKAYTGGFCFNLSWDGSRDGNYEPYQKWSYPLDSDLELRGIPKIDNGNLYYDGDVYEADGTVTRKYGIVDLGTLTWLYQDNNENFYSSDIPNFKVATAWYQTLNMICSKYVTQSANSNATEGCITIKSLNSSCVRIRDDSFNGDKDAFKTAMSGVYLVYELATPTTETAQPFTKTQKCDSGGTEEFVTSGIVSVGHKSKYAEK